MKRIRQEAPVDVLDGLRQPLPMPERALSDRRNAMIRIVARAIRRERRARSKRRRGLVVSAAAAALLLGIGGATMFGAAGGGAPREVAVSTAPTCELRVTAGAVVTTREGVSTAVSLGGTASLRAGDEIRSATDGAAELLLPRKVRVQIGSSTKAEVLAFSEVEQRVRLDLGTTGVSVPRPGGPRTFVIETPDTQVIVHGTKFSVLVERDDATSSTVTSVTVTRGAVLVVHGSEQRLIAAGDVWSSRTAPAPRPAPVGVRRDGGASSDPKAGDRLPSSVAPARLTAQRGPRRSGTLGAQNKLFQAALDASQVGDDFSAVEYLDQLLTRFPNTALTAVARLARARAAERIKRAVGPGPNHDQNQR